MGLQDEFNRVGEELKEVLHGADQAPGSGLPAVETPDQTRHDGVRPDLAGELSTPETSGDLE